MSPGLTKAQSAASGPLRERTGPMAAPQSAPDYARPTPGLAPPPATAQAPTAGGERADAGSFTALRVAREGPEGDARPLRGWNPPEAPGAGLRLEHVDTEPLDEAWVRRQFALNGLPGSGGVSRALALTQLINRAFLSAGYLNSGVVVRPSAAGELKLGLIYGGLTPAAADASPVSVEWLGGDAKGLDADYLRDRLPSAFQRPLNGADLERDFRLLAEDPAILTLNADLRPGDRPGEATLALGVYPQDRSDFYVTAANDRSPSVGGERAAVGGLLRNLVRAGDVLTGEVGETRGLKDAAIGYALPFFSPRTTLSLRAALNDAAVISRPLIPLDIRAQDRSYEVGLIRKVLDTPLLPAAEPGRWSAARTFSAGLLLTHRLSKTSLQGEPFSFSPGAVGGRSAYTALRITGDYLVRSVDQVFAISLTVTRGLDGTGSDIPGLPGPKPHFDALLAQVNYARRLSDRGLEFRARLSGQFADSLLYSGERFSAGGSTTVRGYRENLILADEGVVGSLELARPISLSRRAGGARTFDWGAFAVSAFVDGAALRNHIAPQPQRPIYSLGAALAWTPSDAISAQVIYGHALTNADFSGAKDRQDRGLSFRLTLRPARLVK
jgi:hemolysin activation/secretion protein